MAKSQIQLSLVITYRQTQRAAGLHAPGALHGEQLPELPHCPHLLLVLSGLRLVCPAPNLQVQIIRASLVCVCIHSKLRLQYMCNV